MIRYYILQGDKTTANGVVIATNSLSSHHGSALAMIGDPVYCRTCQTTGSIASQGPRRPLLFHGRQPALDRDLCLCGCRPVPLLINSRIDMLESMTSEEVIAQGYGAWIGAGRQATDSAPDEFLEQYFELADEHSQMPEGYRYDLFDDSRLLHQSQDFSSGRTLSCSGKHMKMIMWLDKSGTIRS